MESLERWSIRRSGKSCAAILWLRASIPDGLQRSICDGVPADAGRWHRSKNARAFASRRQPEGLEGLLKAGRGHAGVSQPAPGAGIRAPRPRLPGDDRDSGGIPFFFSLRDTYVGLPVAVGVFEREVRDCLKLLLRPDMNCIDVGANFATTRFRWVGVRQGGDAYSASSRSRYRSICWS